MSLLHRTAREELRHFNRSDLNRMDQIHQVSPLEHSLQVLKSDNAPLSDVTITDTRDLIDIASGLQNHYQAQSILPLLYKLEELLNISEISVGIFDASTQTNTYIVGTGKSDTNEKLTPHFKQHICQKHYYSSQEQYMFFYGYHKHDICSYLYFKRDTNLLTNNQKQVIKLMQPYLYSTACKLFRISTEFAELNLTSRELEVMEWIKEGKDNWTIGKILGVSERTIKFHVCNLFKKIGVTSRIEAICWYFRFMSSLNTLLDDEPDGNPI